MWRQLSANPEIPDLQRSWPSAGSPSNSGAGGVTTCTIIGGSLGSMCPVTLLEIKSLLSTGHLLHEAPLLFPCRRCLLGTSVPQLSVFGALWLALYVI